MDATVVTATGQPPAAQAGGEGARSIRPRVSDISPTGAQAGRRTARTVIRPPTMRPSVDRRP